MRLITKPWLHFIVLGFILLFAQRLLQPQPMVDIHPPSQQKIQQLTQQWQKTTGQLASAAQVQRLLEQETEQEILFQAALAKGWHLSDEIVRARLIKDIRFLDPTAQGNSQQLIQTAISLNLHENDEVVRRRLIQRMQMGVLQQVRSSSPPASELKKRYNLVKQQYQTDTLISFEHKFFSADRNADAQAKAGTALETIDSLSTSQLAAVGDLFLHSGKLGLQSQQQVARNFGTQFSAALFEQQQLAVWLGPLASSFGQHLIKLNKIIPSRQKTFAEVEAHLAQQWYREQEQLAVKQLLKKLRLRYRVLTPVQVAADV